MNKLSSHKLTYGMKVAIPIAVVGAGVTLFAWVAIQQDYRQSANDPQIQMAEDGATSIGNNLTPAAVVGAMNVDASSSLAPFITIYDSKLNVLATSGKFDGQILTPPSGTFQYAKSHGQDRFTWQPTASSREAAILVYTGNSHPGYVMAARSINEVEKRENSLGMLGMVTLLAIAVFLVAWALIADLF